MEEKKVYYRRIEIIRALSCILVLLYHLNILKGGFLAVCTFFTLSGYLSCMSALKNEKFSIKLYYKNRIKKLYFPLIIVVFSTVIIVKINTNINWINLKQETISALLGYNNIWQLKANLDYFTRNINSPFTHLWYISILLQFDLVFPIIFTILKKVEDKVKNNISTYVVILITIITTFLFYYMSKTQNVMTVYYNTFARSFSILFGILLAIIHYKYNFKVSKFFEKDNTVLFVIYNLFLIILCIMVPANNPEKYWIYMIICTIISTRLIEYATKESIDFENFEKHIRPLSKMSYEIYLVQYPIIFFMQKFSQYDFLNSLIAILLTLISAFSLQLMIYFPLKSKMGKKFKIIFFSILITIGSFIVVTEKDHTAEMKELENKLNENLRIIEEKNNEYNNNLDNEKREWNSILESMEDEEEKIGDMIKKLPVIGVGDSVLLGAINELYNTFPNGYFDGKVSRTIWGAEDLLINLKKEGKLGDTLILCLATNGDYSVKRNDELMSIVENREIYWINAVGADDPKFNDRFREYASNYPNIHIVEWDSVAKNYPEYFYADGIHVNNEGAKLYANTIYETIYNVYLEKYKTKKNEIIQKHEEEQKDKIAFYGDNILTNAFDILNKRISKASFNANADYTFESLYKEIEEKVKNNMLEYKIVLLFDNERNISEEEYKKIIDLCKDHKLYILNMTSKKYSFSSENVKIIEFYHEIINNENYTIADRIHLSSIGNEALVNLIINTLENS